MNPTDTPNHPSIQQAMAEIPTSTIRYRIFILEARSPENLKASMGKRLTIRKEATKITPYQNH